MDPHRGAVPSTLVVVGPHRLTRNPMYLGMALLLGAHAVLLGRVRAWPPVVAFLVWLDAVQVPAEETALQEAFGATYEAYADEVPRWLTARVVRRPA